MKISKYEISKRLLLMLGVGVFIIALAALGYLYMNEMQEQQDLEDELASVENQIDVINDGITGLQEEKDRLEGEISDSEAKIVEIEAELTTSLLSSDIFKDLFTVASATNVDISIIRETAINDSTIAGITYKAREINFTVNGSASNVYKFVDKLHNDLKATILKTLVMQAESSPYAATSANMLLTIYSYK